MSEHKFSVSLRLIENYLFEIDFGEFGDLMTDEAEPLGQGEGPNPARLLAASVANCLCASLLFALRKFKDDPDGLSATVSGELQRVEKRWRIESLEVTIELGQQAGTLAHLERALGQFEDFCVVTQSVRRGIDVKVSVRDSTGRLCRPASE